MKYISPREARRGRMRIGFLALLIAVAVPAEAQVCRVSVAGLNQNRRASGGIHAECPVSVHTPPFGNWGVTSNFGQKGDSRQFDGWCHDSRVCDNNGNCRTSCTDGWYEWNSCTDIAQYAPPNCTLYNVNCTEQVTTTGINVHGTRTIDVPVSCPIDTDGDGSPDKGGCRDLGPFSNGTNFMSIYELDPGTSDTLIQTLYFPEAPVTLNCDVWGCESAVSQWMAPTFYNSPSSPPKIYAEMAMLVNSAMFMDQGRACAIPPRETRTVSAASFQPLIAPDSIATIFGSGLAISTASATSTPLPLSLAGASLTLQDAQGRVRSAGLFYVSPRQINLLVPADMAAGPASVTVRRTDGVVSQGTAQIAGSAPGLFSADSSGRGPAAGYGVRVLPNGGQEIVTLYNCGGGSCVAVPVDLSRGTVVLVLYGTGIRLAAASGVTVTIGGQSAPIYYAGPQGQYEGLDQINAAIPSSLAGRGEVSVLLSAAGRQANAVSIAIE